MGGLYHMAHLAVAFSFSDIIENMLRIWYF